MPVDASMMDPVEEFARIQEEIYNTEKEIERVKEEGPGLIAELESRLIILQLREVSLQEKAQQPVARLGGLLITAVWDSREDISGASAFEELKKRLDAKKQAADSSEEVAEVELEEEAVATVYRLAFHKSCYCAAALSSNPASGTVARLMKRMPVHPVGYATSSAGSSFESGRGGGVGPPCKFALELL